MKHLSDYDNMFESEPWYFWGNIKALLGHLDWGLATKGSHSDPTNKTLLSAMFVCGQTFC